MSQTFPRTTVENISLPRMLMGTNWMLGWSHTSVSADHMIQNRYQAPSSFRAMADFRSFHRVKFVYSRNWFSPMP